MTPISKIASRGNALDPGRVAEVLAQACPAKDYRDKKVLVIVPMERAPLGRFGF